MKFIKHSAIRFTVSLVTAASLGISTGLGGTSSILTDLELSLATDVSGSVSDSDYQLMIDGYTNAFRSQQLIDAVERGVNGSIAVNLVFFDSSAFEGIGFRLITNASEANMFADELTALRSNRPGGGGTDIGDGIDLSSSLLSSNIYDGRRVVIDVAGDGTGSSPGTSRDNALQSGVDTINGIVIGTSDPNGALAQFYEDEVIGGDGAFVAVAPTFADFEPEILAKIEREITGVAPSGTATLMNSALRSSSITAGRTVIRDVGGRLYRMRSGIRSEPVVHTEPAPPSAKGGMAKGGMSKTPITHSHVCRWEVYGQVFYSTEDQDSIFSGLGLPGTAQNFVVTRPETSIDVFGGTVGFEYDFNETWSAGFAISGARSDVDMTFVGTADIDTLALIPYVSYHRAISGMDFYADLLYAYGMNDYDTFRFPGANGDTEGDFHALEFNTGLVMRNGQVAHGPYAQLRWLDGDIDGYTEAGPGAAVFPDSKYKSLATQLGYQASYQVQLSSGVLVPQARAAWEHEFESDQGNLAGIPVGQVDEDLAVLGVGVGYFLNCGWNVVLDYEARLGSESQSHYIGLKGGFEF